PLVVSFRRFVPNTLGLTPGILLPTCAPSRCSPCLQSDLMRILTPQIRSVGIISAVLLSLLPVPDVLLAEITITNIPGLGGSATEVIALNNSGMVAGFSRTPADADQHAFLFSGGILYDLGGHFSVAYGV